MKVDSFSEGTIWLKLDKNLFNLPNNLFICAIYIPPEYNSSALPRVDYYKELTASISKYLRKGNVILGGDFNARTGNKDEHNNFSIEVPGVIELSDEDGPKLSNRLSCDEKVNNYGKKLSSICKSQDLVIANGRIIGDRIGNFTCQNSRGSSVVDYFISDNDFFDRLKLLRIHEPIFGSIHSPLSLLVDCSFDHQRMKKAPLPKPPRMVWDKSKAKDFIGILQNKQVEFNSLHNLLSNVDCSKKKTTELTKRFTDLLTDCAKMYFKFAKPRKRKEKENY